MQRHGGLASVLNFEVILCTSGTETSSPFFLRLKDWEDLAQWGKNERAFF